MLVHPNSQGIESVLMLPMGADCHGCEGKEKEYFVTSGSKGKILYEK